jgi:hypothetical protein
MSVVVWGAGGGRADLALLGVQFSGSFIGEVQEFEKDRHSMRVP